MAKTLASGVKGNEWASGTDYLSNVERITIGWSDGARYQ